jgi:hypothetical protein
MVVFSNLRELLKNVLFIDIKKPENYKIFQSLRICLEYLIMLHLIK